MKRSDPDPVLYVKGKVNSAVAIRTQRAVHIRENLSHCGLGRRNNIKTLQELLEEEADDLPRARD